tara:strand:+ start:154 stop:435 length:282 start_codon:yes stop_codon:yes gene_type:complete
MSDVAYLGRRVPAPVVFTLKLILDDLRSSMPTLGRRKVKRPPDETSSPADDDTILKELVDTPEMDEIEYSNAAGMPTPSIIYLVNIKIFYIKK